MWQFTPIQIPTKRLEINVSNMKFNKNLSKSVDKFKGSNVIIIGVIEILTNLAEKENKVFFGTFYSFTNLFSQ